jgi:putative thioredoxin
VQPLARLKPLFDKHVPRASEGLREQAQAKLSTGDAAGAAALLRKLLAEDPENTAARIDLADAVARDGDVDEADRLLDALPPNVATSIEAEQARARVHFTRHAASASEAQQLRASVTEDNADLAAIHKLASYELLHGDVARALELLLTVMQRDRRFQEDLGRRSLLHAFKLLGEADERVGEYRKRMTRLLY